MFVIVFSRYYEKQNENVWKQSDSTSIRRVDENIHAFIQGTNMSGCAYILRWSRSHTLTLFLYTQFLKSFAAQLVYARREQYNALLGPSYVPFSHFSASKITGFPHHEDVNSSLNNGLYVMIFVSNSVSRQLYAQTDKSSSSSNLLESIARLKSVLYCHWTENNIHEVHF